MKEKVFLLTDIPGVMNVDHDLKRTLIMIVFVSKSMLGEKGCFFCLGVRKIVIVF